MDKLKTYELFDFFKKDPVIKCVNDIKYILNDENVKVEVDKEKTSDNSHGDRYVICIIPEKNSEKNYFEDEDLSLLDILETDSYIEFMDRLRDELGDDYQFLDPQVDQLFILIILYRKSNSERNFLGVDYSEINEINFIYSTPKPQTLTFFFSDYKRADGKYGSPFLRQHITKAVSSYLKDVEIKKIEKSLEDAGFELRRKFTSQRWDINISGEENVDNFFKTLLNLKKVNESQIFEEISFNTLKIVKIPDPILRKKCRDIELIDGKVPKEIKKLSEDMIATMRFAFGCGIAGPQVGRDINIFIMNNGLFRNEVIINPIIISKSSQMVSGREGCLSIPNRSGYVSRHKSLKAEWTNLDGKRVQTEFTGFPAIIFQHEYDHLQGILFTDKMR